MPYMPGIVVSIFDRSATAVLPWAEAGYACFCYDLQHEFIYTNRLTGGGSITYVPWDANDGCGRIVDHHIGDDVAIVLSGAPCDHLAVSGAKHFKRKLAVDPDIQKRAVAWARMAEKLSAAFDCIYVVENPVSILATLWRPANFTFHPYQFGGYIPETEAVHPEWPDYIAPRDAYTKLTCLWTSDDFTMPNQKPVDVIKVCVPTAKGDSLSSRQFAKLGGSSLKTKNIRAAAPRGFWRAVFFSNQGNA